MLRQRKILNFNTAQSVIEYTIIMGIISMVIMNMSVMIKRFAQGSVKIVADQVGAQVNGDQTFDPKRGFMNATYTLVKSNVDTTIIEGGGERKKYFNDITEIETNTFSDLGWTDTDPYGDNR